MQQVTTVLIIPVYNPLPGWEQLLYKRYTELKNTLQQPLQLYIVNDGSTNGLFHQAVQWLQTKDSNICIISFDVNEGKGAALRKGLSTVEADYYAFTDVDFPYTTNSAGAIINCIQMQTADIAIGNRDRQYYKQINNFRAALSKLVRFFIRHLMRIPFDDTQCGLKAFNKKGKQLFLSTTINTYLFDMEFVLLSVRAKAHVQTVPVELRNDIRLSRMPAKVLINELKNFLKLLFR
jgi:glycosyltransferase involved in cell wall biosynthesis